MGYRGHPGIRRTTGDRSSALIERERQLTRERVHRDLCGDLRRGLILTRTMFIELAEEIEALGLTALAWRYRALASGFDVAAGSSRVH
jgi:hypothetical protein